MKDSLAQKTASRGADFKGRFGWMMFDWAAQPYFTLILTFIFAPYFTNHFMADGVQGQAAWSFTQTAAGLILAIMAPILGSIADRTGPRKPWIMVFAVVYIIGTSLLWFAAPGAENMISLVVVAIILAAVGIEFAGVFNNAMLPSVAQPGKMGKLSGFGWALGYVGGLITLVIVLGLLSASKETGLTMLGLAPVLDFDPHLYEADRFVGPLAAIWFVIFVIPMFLFTPDEVPREIKKAKVVDSAIAGLKDTGVLLAGLLGRPNILKFFVARMVYYDGLSALFAFGGIYASFVFDWTITTLGVFGIILSVAAALGAYVGGWCDDWFGPKKTIIVALVGLIVSALGILSVDGQSALWLIDLPQDTGETGLFATLGEKIILIFGIGIGLFAGPAQAASRTMLVKIIPEGETTKYFGLFALSGKATAFLAPLLIGILTLAFDDQRMSLVTIIGFLVVGIVVFLSVKEERE
ncbi:MAG: MFS transporter [Hyphomicrobiales bacterium]|nr:MAG: MFS transporter [Hyphomicrobiales bacterium]